VSPQTMVAVKSPAGVSTPTPAGRSAAWHRAAGRAKALSWFSLAWMTAVGERTERLILGTSVLTPTFRYNPAVIAQARPGPVLLYAGRLAKEKNLDLLLDAFALFHDRRPDAHLVIVGDGPHRAELEQRAQTAPWGAHVHFAGELAQRRVLDQTFPHRSMAAA